MRIFFTLILATLIGNGIIAQPHEIGCKDFDISQMEMKNYQNKPGPIYSKTGASKNFDVKYYRCEWELDPAVEYIQGKVTVHFDINPGSDYIILDLMSSLQVKSVTRKDISLAIEQGDTTIKINFPVAYADKTLDSVSIYYEGKPSTSGFGTIKQTTHVGIPVMWNLSEPFGSRDWWPCKNGLDDKADSLDVFIKHHQDYKAVSNGVLQSEVVDEKTVTTHWKHRYPIASYLVCFALTNYTTFTNIIDLGQGQQLPMQTFCFPESLAEYQTAAGYAAEQIKFFSVLFGDYPFIKEKYGHVQIINAHSMENQTCSFLSSGSDGLVAHELAHHWFGDKVTCGSWEDIWLNEGFASFVGGLYYEVKSGFLSAKFSRTNRVKSITSQPGGSVKVDDTTNVGRIFSGRLSYSKGAHLLEMLRWTLGAKPFFNGLKSYLDDPKLAYGYARTNDLKKHLEKASGKDLTQFFKDWYEGQGFPSYTIKWTKIAGSKVKITVNQKTSHPSVSFFALPVELQFVKGDLTKTVVVDNTFNGQVFIFPIDFTPDTMLIDPNYWLITNKNISKKEFVLSPFMNGKTVDIFPNPIVNNEFTIQFKNFPTDGVASIAIYNTMGNVVYNGNVQIVRGEVNEKIVFNQLPKGEYTLQIQTPEGEKISKKIVK